MKVFILFSVLAFSFSGPVFANEVYLKSGQVISLKNVPAGTEKIRCQKVKLPRKAKKPKMDPALAKCYEPCGEDSYDLYDCMKDRDNCFENYKRSKKYRK